MTAFSVVVLYIFETLIIVLYGLLKMKRLAKENKKEIPDIGFYLIVYSVFVLAQLGFFLVFMGIYFDTQDSNLTVWSFFTGSGLWKSTLFLTVHHGFSYYWNFIRKKEYMKTDKDTLFKAPFQRVKIQQITVIAGGIFLGIINGAIAFMAVLIAAKIIIDLREHIKAHRTT